MGWDVSIFVTISFMAVVFMWDPKPLFGPTGFPCGGGGLGCFVSLLKGAVVRFFYGEREREKKMEREARGTIKQFFKQ